MPTPTEWGAKFVTWGSPPGQTEQDKCENAVRAVGNAIDASQALAARRIRVFAQGSYRNRTNVRAESDVDICVYCPDPFFYDLPIGATPAQFNVVTPAAYTFQQYRADVGAALVAHFGAQAVTSGKKAFDIHQNTYRIAADAVPVMEYRRFQFGAPPVLGAAFLCDGRLIINYPDQHYANGVSKNTGTGRRFKAVARILKRLRYEMLATNGHPSAMGVQSYELESLVWNVPSALFAVSPDVRGDVQAIVIHAWDQLETDAKCAAWTEVNGIKPLFGAGQPWSREDARTFLYDAWNYAELGT